MASNGSVVLAIVAGSMLIAYVALVVGLLLPRPVDPVLGEPIPIRTRAILSWLPVLGGLGTSLYIVFGPLIETARSSAVGVLIVSEDEICPFFGGPGCPKRFLYGQG